MGDKTQYDVLLFDLGGVLIDFAGFDELEIQLQRLGLVDQ